MWSSNKVFKAYNYYNRTKDYKFFAHLYKCYISYHNYDLDDIVFWNLSKPNKLRVLLIINFTKRR